MRLSAEMIRDQALALSGLLGESIGGPSVKPYQPAGLWEEIAGGAMSAYKGATSRTEVLILCRRSLYTFWRRTIHPPGMEVFDVPSRETCTVRRERTNTPLQALALMNDLTYVEAARALGRRLIREGGSTDDDRVAFGFRLSAFGWLPRDDRLPACREAEHGGLAFVRIGDGELRSAYLRGNDLELEKGRPTSVQAIVGKWVLADAAPGSEVSGCR